MELQSSEGSAGAGGSSSIPTHGHWQEASLPWHMGFSLGMHTTWLLTDQVIRESVWDQDISHNDITIISALFIGPTDQPDKMWERTTQGYVYQEDVGHWHPVWGLGVTVLDTWVVFTPKDSIHLFV